jgi:hypothetical protein
MIAKHKIILAACTLMVQGIGAANAGPCNTRDKDAGSGPSPATRGRRLAQVRRIQSNTRPLTQ